MTVAGIGIAAQLVSHAGAEVSVGVADGGCAQPGDLLLSASGPRRRSTCPGRQRKR